MSQKKTAEKKIIDLDAIQDMADKAGMTASELLEWGMYQIVSPHEGLDRDPGAAAKSLENLREWHGEIPKQLIPTNPLADFAAEAGISFSELNELALLVTFDMLKATEYPNPDMQPRDLLEEERREQGPLFPSFSQDRVKVHPMMAALFSGDLRAVHGSTFGDLCSDHVDCEHIFLEECLQRAFFQNSWGECTSDLISIESVIRHCPKLQNEAAAIRALLEADRVLSDFCQAVKAN